MSVDRMARLDSLLRRVIADEMRHAMQGDTVDPGLITVTAVHTGRDLRDATVSVSVFGDAALKARAIERLRRNARKFQKAINEQVRMKFTPKLLFKLDESLERGDAVLAILDSLPRQESTDAAAE